MKKESESFNFFDERILLILLAGIVLVGFFIFDIFGQSTFIQIIRYALIIFVFVAIYFLWPSEDDYDEFENREVDSEEAHIEIQSLVENSTGMDFLLDDQKVDFYKELSHFVGNLIKMVCATFVAHSAIIFLWDKKTEKLRIEFCESKSQTIKRGDLVDTNGTLPGSVYLNQTAILEQNIPNEGQPVSYYRESKEIKSFLAVPVSINNEVQGLLAVDSLVAHDFSEDDLELLKAFEGLIGQGIHLVGEREKSQLVNQSIKAQRILLNDLNEDLSYDNLYSAIGNSCKSIYQFDRLTVSTIDSDDSEMGIITKVIGQRDAMGEGFRYSLNDGISGWVIRKNQPLLLGDLEKGDLFRPRYSGSDKSNFGLRSFLGVPIGFRSQVFGMISLESKQPDFYTDWDQNVLTLLASNVGLAFLSLRLLPSKV